MTLPLIKTGTHLIICLAILRLIYGFNHHYASVDIAFADVLVLSLLYMLVYFFLAGLFELIWARGWLLRLFLMAAYLLFAFNIVPVIDSVIYKVLPAVGVEFFDESVPRNDAKFHYRIWRGFFIVNMFAGGYLLFIKGIKAWQVIKAANRQIDVYRQRVNDAEYTSHFMKSVFESTFGKMLLNEEAKDRRTLLDAVEFLGYLFSAEKLGSTDEWLIGLDKLDCFIRLFKKHYGAKSIVYEFNDDGAPPATLPRGFLLFPLENCLKHALISVDCPVFLRVDVAAGVLRMHCSNRIDRLKQDRVAGNGFGYLKDLVDDHAYSLLVDTKTEQEFFYLDILLKPKYDAKVEVQNAYAGRQAG